ncbi:MAG: methionine--tRNA ligase [Pseudomonadota bacterium]
MPETFYITTPIYYVNDVPHIGHAYTTIAADVLARYKRMKGCRVFFLTGTDEHGLKVEQAAQEAGETPIQLADRVVQRFQTLWQKLNISHDDFIRTSEQRHKDAVAKFFKKVEAGGDVYLGSYEDWYCVPCESFWTATQLVEGKCPDCRRPVEKLKEESYFFRLSKYREPLLEYYAANRAFIKPESRYNEIVSFVSESLRDLSISRTSFTWGIKIPGNPKHIFYVWFDALLNYISAIDYSGEGDTFASFWPANVHIMGKDILRFHAVYWPAFLLSAGLPLPRQVFAHGWWTIEDRKMSKSLGNVIDPYALAEEYGADAVRYFLLREVPFGLDGDYSRHAIITRINSDLANDFGNLVSRTISMVHKYFDGVLPRSGPGGELENRLRVKALQVFADVDDHMSSLSFHKALVSIWEFISLVNKYIDETAPWALAKDEGQQEKLATVMVHCVEALKKTAVLLAPFMPSSSQKLWEVLREEGDVGQQHLQDVMAWDTVTPGTGLQKISALFPRIQTESRT